jgi:hypothetical protein
MPGNAGLHGAHRTGRGPAPGVANGDREMARARCGSSDRTRALGCRRSRTRRAARCCAPIADRPDGGAGSRRRIGPGSWCRQQSCESDAEHRRRSSCESLGTARTDRRGGSATHAASRPAHGGEEKRKTRRRSSRRAGARSENCVARPHCLHVRAGSRRVRFDAAGAPRGFRGAGRICFDARGAGACGPTAACRTVCRRRVGCASVCCRGSATQGTGDGNGSVGVFPGGVAARSREGNRARTRGDCVA